MRSGLQIGDQAELVWRVAADHVIHLGYPPPSQPGGLIAAAATAVPEVSAVVFSTPNMILLMERAARKLLQPYLEPGEESVGAMVQVEHLAGTPLGAMVRGVARVTHIDRRLIDFEITAFDGQEQIGRGTHRRAVVSLQRVAQRMADKAAALQSQGSLGEPDDEPVAGDTRPPGHALSAASEVAAAVPSAVDLARLATLQVELDGPIATVTLNRPAKKTPSTCR